MAIALLNANEEGELSSNYAEFENDEITGQNHGVCSWGEPYYHEENERWEVPNVQGYNVQGTAFNAGTLIDIPENKTITPTDVFWWAAGVLKSTLCPSCM